MMKKGFIFLAALAALLAGSLPAAAASAGAEPFNFLFLDANARATALGGAYTALAKDANALHYNPAGLGRINNYEFTFMHNRHFEGISRQYMALATRQGWGANLNYLTFGDVPRTTVSNPSGAGLGSAQLSAMSFSLGYGRTIYELISVGVGLKYIRETIDHTSGVGKAVDLGLLYEVSNVPDLRFGLAVQNIGPTASFETAKENLPLNVRLGSAFDFNFAQRVHTVSLDVTKERSETVLISFGLEARPHESLPVRFGFSTRNDAGPGFSAGFGWISPYLEVDYAFVPFGTLGFSHQIGATFRWGDQTRPLLKSRTDNPFKKREKLKTAEDRLERVGEYLSLNLINEAKEELGIVEKLVHAKDPRRVRYLERMGTLALIENSPSEAKSHFKNALKLTIELGIRGPSVADSYFGMARCLLLDGNEAYAEKFLRRALQTRPSPQTRRRIKDELRKLHSR